jgi:DNA primase
MRSVTTYQGKHIHIVSQRDLRSPIQVGDYIRVYCHIHGSDHQRSLSISRATGWGHCFNAACNATVLVEEYNPVTAARLSGRAEVSYRTPLYDNFHAQRLIPPLARQLVLLYPQKETTLWQQEEAALLASLSHSLRRGLMHTPKARAYLYKRGIPLEVAISTGVGYLPFDRLAHFEAQQRHLLSRWADRIVFPLASPHGEGMIGRSLWGWQSGMDERQHKAVLEQPESPKRWIKTNPAGWFCDPDQLAETIVLVEGGFDRLALLSAGFAAEDVVALVGTAAPVEWIPGQVKRVLLALDGDAGGRGATERLADQFRQAGLTVSVCLPPQDNGGKDWNERWRQLGMKGLRPLIESFRFFSARTRSTSPAVLRGHRVTG